MVATDSHIYVNWGNIQLVDVYLCSVSSRDAGSNSGGTCITVQVGEGMWVYICDVFMLYVYSVATP